MLEKKSPRNKAKWYRSRNHREILLRGNRDTKDI